MGAGRHLVSYPLRGGTLRNIVAVEERRQWADEGWALRDDPFEMRLAFEPVALLALLGDVGDDQHVVKHLAGGVIDGGDRHLQRAGLAAAPAFDDLAAPAPGAAQAGPHQQPLLSHQRIGR